MKKKFLALVLVLVFILGALAGCGGGNNSSASKSASDGGNSDMADNNQNGSVTLAGMKKAAGDAGYEVEDSYSTSWGENIVAGFTVTYPGEHADIHTPVLEFRDKASADAVAKREQDAGYNYPVQNGKFLTFASASNGMVDDEAEKTFFENLINGGSVEKAP